MVSRSFHIKIKLTELYAIIDVYLNDYYSCEQTKLERFKAHARKCYNWLMLYTLNCVYFTKMALQSDMNTVVMRKS